MNKISSKHLMLFILAVITISVRTYSSIFIELGGRDTWIISIIAAIAIYLFIFAIFKISIKKDSYDMNIIFEKAFSKPLAKIFIFIFSIGLFLISIESASVEASSINNNFFLDTPIWYCLLFFIIPAGYVATKSFNTILIIVITTVFINIIGDVVILALIMKYLNLNYLLPILQNSFSYSNLKCLLLLIGSLSSISIILPFLKYYNKKRALIIDTTLAIVIASFFITTSFASIISLFSVDRASNIFYPEYIEYQRIKIANFLEFGELFFIFRNVCIWFLKYILSLYGILLLYKDIITNRKIFITLYSIVIFIISYKISGNDYTLFSILKGMQISLLIPFIIIPLLGYSLYYFRGDKKGKFNVK